MAEAWGARAVEFTVVRVRRCHCLVAPVWRGNRAGVVVMERLWKDARGSCLLSTYLLIDGKGAWIEG